MYDINKKVDRGVNWFHSLTQNEKEEAFRRLLEYSVESEYIGIWDDKDANELARESGKSIDKYLAPYFTSCGEPLV